MAADMAGEERLMSRPRRQRGPMWYGGPGEPLYIRWRRSCVAGPIDTEVNYPISDGAVGLKAPATRADPRIHREWQANMVILIVKRTLWHGL